MIVIITVLIHNELVKFLTLKVDQMCMACHFLKGQYFQFYLVSNCTLFSWWIDQIELKFLVNTLCDGPFGLREV